MYHRYDLKFAIEADSAYIPTRVIITVVERSFSDNGIELELDARETATGNYPFAWANKYFNREISGEELVFLVDSTKDVRTVSDELMQGLLRLLRADAKKFASTLVKLQEFLDFPSWQWMKYDSTTGNVTGFVRGFNLPWRQPPHHISRKQVMDILLGRGRPKMARALLEFVEDGAPTKIINE